MSKLKLEKEFFKSVQDSDFFTMMALYSKCLDEYAVMMNKINQYYVDAEQPSRNHLYKMRQASINLQKFGKLFRDRTIKFYKMRAEGLMPRL